MQNAKKTIQKQATTLETIKLITQAETISNKLIRSGYE